MAQHTLLVEAVMREQMPRVDISFRLAALLHDAPEYVIGDMISPFKAVLGGDYKVVEKRLLAAIHIRFGLPPVLADEITQAIKAADRGAAYLEATQLAGFAEAEAKRLFGRDPGLPEATERDYLTPWTAAKAEKQFLARFKLLHLVGWQSRALRLPTALTRGPIIRLPRTKCRNRGSQGTP